MREPRQEDQGGRPREDGVQSAFPHPGEAGLATWRRKPCSPGAEPRHPHKSHWKALAQATGAPTASNKQGPCQGHRAPHLENAQVGSGELTLRRGRDRDLENLSGNKSQPQLGAQMTRGLSDNTEWVRWAHLRLSERWGRGGSLEISPVTNSRCGAHAWPSSGTTTLSFCDCSRHRA